MRKEYDFSKAVPFKEGRRLRRGSHGLAPAHDADAEVAPLTRAQIRELDRRIKDSMDRTRYLLVSAMTPRFVLYYNVSEDTFEHNNARHATLFKRRAAADAVRRHLGDRVQLVRCRANARGQLVLASIPKLRYNWSRWRRKV
jgi:hypothetical protein